MTDSTSGAARDAGPVDRTGSAARLPAALLGVIAVVLGALVLVDAATIRAPAGQSFVGPAAFPVGVGVLLIATGGTLTGRQIMMFVRAKGEARAGGGRRGWPAGLPPLGRVAALLALLVGYAALLPRLSYVLSTALLFSGVSLLFGSGHRVRTIVIGVALAAAAFFAFARGIGVSLPAGPWGF
jgi:putative tricarboxylic transport membrane protein